MRPFLESLDPQSGELRPSGRRPAHEDQTDGSGRVGADTAKLQPELQ